jgi:cytochrome c-type biogenesis protein CcmE
MTRSGPKSRRLLVLGGAGLALGLAVALLLTALREDIVFFRSPTDILQEATAENTQLRLGGMVEDGSLARSTDGLSATFLVTDGTSSISVSYHGILPDLLREGQGVVVEGKMRAGTFQAATVMAKHDENYMPREVKDALDRGGYGERRDAAVAQTTSALPSQ